jgi:hypothetical protein
VAANQSEIVIYIDPEALVVGRVNLPGVEGDMRIRTDLYRREIREGQEHWELARTFTTRADGEFRFFDLSPGTYKLGTGEQLDRDPLIFSPGGQLFGFPPVFIRALPIFQWQARFNSLRARRSRPASHPSGTSIIPSKFPSGMQLRNNR